MIKTRKIILKITFQSGLKSFFQIEGFFNIANNFKIK
jgi:hypothetical protein